MVKFSVCLRFTVLTRPDLTGSGTVIASASGLSPIPMNAAIPVTPNPPAPGSVWSTGVTTDSHWPVVPSFTTLQIHSLSISPSWVTYASGQVTKAVAVGAVGVQSVDGNPVGPVYTGVKRSAAIVVVYGSETVDTKFRRIQGVGCYNV